MMWFRAHRNCPVCKRHLEVSQLHDITMKPQELQVRNEDVDRGEQEMSPTGTRRTSGIAKKTMIYSAFDSQQLAEIKNIELDGPSYTTKVDTLVRHLFWLRENDPGAKSIVFSQ
jgi:E3 ubiquitin-protein ligase SHPRH